MVALDFMCSFDALEASDGQTDRQTAFSHTPETRMSTAFTTSKARILAVARIPLAQTKLPEMSAHPAGRDWVDLTWRQCAKK